MELRKPDNKLLLAALRWHDNEEVNKMTGAGGGYAGKVHAQTFLKEKIFNPNAKDMIFLGVWDNEQPVGYIAFSDINPTRRVADLHITIDPERAKEGLGTEAMRLAFEHAFKSDLYRIQFQPFKNNKAAVALAKKLSMTLEAFTKSSAWVQDSPRDQALFRMLRPEWERIKKAREARKLPIKRAEVKKERD